MKTLRSSHAPRRLLRAAAVIAVALAGLWASGVRLFAFPGETMIPAVGPGDYFVGVVGWWGHRPPQRFDLVIFDVPPTSKWAERRIPWLKRLVGLPGENVRLTGGELFIDGRMIEPCPLHSRKAAAFEMQLAADEYCVLGDNLDRTFDDSRSLGPIAASLIKGRAIWVLHCGADVSAGNGGKTTVSPATPAVPDSRQP